MVPKISVRRKGDDIFLTVEGNYSSESLRELLSMVRQLLITSLKCAAPGSQMIYNLKIRGKVDRDKISNVQEVHSDQSYSHETIGDLEERQQQKVMTRQGEPLVPENRRGFILLKGGAC